MALTGSSLVVRIDGQVGQVDILQGTTINVVVLTGSDADGHAGTEAEVSLGFDGIGTLTGVGGGGSSLTGRDTVSVWALDGTPTYDGGVDPALNFTGFLVLQGGTDTDAFNVSAVSTFNLFGGDTGVDTFDIDAALTGSIDGETGVDILQGTAIDAAVLTGSDADGHAGTEADVSLGFDGIGTITGTGGTLTGRNLASTWDLDGTPTYNDGSFTLNIGGFAALQGGTNTDAFNVSAASTFNLLGGAGIDTFDIDVALTGSIDGQVGVDILQGTTINVVVLTGSDADGHAGTEAEVSLGFDGIGTLTGVGGGGSSLTGRDTVSVWALDGTPTYDGGVDPALNFTGFLVLQGGTDTDAFNVSAVSTFNLFGGDTGVDTFDIDAELTGSIDGETGVDILQGTAIDAAVLTGSDADGFAGTEADVSLGFDGIGTITGTGGTLTGRNLASTWDLDGTPTYNDGSFTLNIGGFAALQGGTNTDAFNVSAASTFNLLGGTGTDSFTLSGGSGTLTGTIDGEGGGTDTLTGDDVANTWGVTGNTSGTLTGVSGGYSNIEILVGGSNTDAFNITDGVVVPGSIDGNAGIDTLNLSAYTSARTVAITATSTTDGFDGTEASVTGGFNDINTLTLPAGAGDSLTGANFANAFAITGGDSGTLTENGQVLTWSGVDALTGNAAVDTFDFTNAGSLTGAIDGAGGTADVLTGDADGNAFAITGANSGTLAGKTSAWSNVENLTGDAGVDTFTFTNAGSLTGAVDGAGGTADVLTGDADGNAFAITGANSGTLAGKTSAWSNVENLTGDAGVDTFTFTNAGSLTGAVDGAGGTADVLTGDADGNIFVITGADTGTLAVKIGTTWSGNREPHRWCGCG